MFPFIESLQTKCQYQKSPMTAWWLLLQAFIFHLMRWIYWKNILRWPKKIITNTTKQYCKLVFWREQNCTVFIIVMNCLLLKKKDNKNVFFPLFFFLVPFAPLSYNEKCAHSYDVMSVWKIMSSASLLLIEANNLSLEKLYTKWLSSLPAFKTAWPKRAGAWGTKPSRRSQSGYWGPQYWSWWTLCQLGRWTPGQ